MTAKICTEKRDERAELFFCQSKVAVLVDVAVIIVTHAHRLVLGKSRFRSRTRLYRI